MPSDLKRDATTAADGTPAVDPPGAKLLVKLFLIPFAIVGAAVGVMFVISLLAGRAPTVDESIAGLKGAGGGRTADVLIGPGSKQRYLYAKTLTDHMKAGLSTSERVKLTADLIDILDNHTQPADGEVQHFLLVALGRCWQINPRQPDDAAVDTSAARQRAADALLRYAGAKETDTRKAAILAMVYFQHRDEAERFKPVLTARVRDSSEDLDVRMSAATVLGPLSTASDVDAIDALHVALRDTDPHNLELVWQSALSLAQLNQPEVADTILKLLNRDELSTVKVYDREKDANNPIFRKLSEAEQERILINTMIGVEHYPVPAVQEQLKKLATNDPSQRVRAALQAGSAKDAGTAGR